MPAVLGKSAVENDLHERFLRHFTASEHAIRAHIRRLVPTHADSDEVMQEVAVVLWRKFSDFSPQASFVSWAFGVAKYEVLAWRRRQARSRVVLAGDVIDLMAEDSARDDSRFARQRELLAHCLSRLGHDKRELLLAAYAPATRIQDVAARSGRTVGGFYQWLHRMKRLLLDCVRAEMERLGEA